MGANEDGISGRHTGQYLPESRDGSFLHVGPALTARPLHVLTAAVPRPEVGEPFLDLGGNEIGPFAIGDLTKPRIMLNLETEEIGDGLYGVRRTLKI